MSGFYLVTAPSPMVGFTIEAADCWWVACNDCGDSELVYGTTASVDASVWASEHKKECAG